MLRLDGIHHITCITSDGPANAEFYLQVMGLRLVKKTVNFDVPDSYHLYYGSEGGEPGSLLTFFEYPNASPGRAGAGQIHRLVWRVPSEASLEYWAARLDKAGVATSEADSALRFKDREGLGFELVVNHSGDPPLVADATDVAAEHRITGFQGVAAYTDNPDASEELLVKALGFSLGDHFSVGGETRTATYKYEAAPSEPAIEGAGSAHHIAWACEPSDQLAWRQRALDAGMNVTEVLDRKYFRSIYFREPSGVLFEIATMGPGFAVDEPAEHLGEALMLPNMHEALREQLEATLRPINNPRVNR